LRFIGGFFLRLPLVRLRILIRSISLSGFPFLAGFFSKDIIIESSILLGDCLFTYLILFTCCILTVCYSLRLCQKGLAFFRIREKVCFFYRSYLINFGLITLSFWSISLGKIMGFNVFGVPRLLIIKLEKLVGLWVIGFGLLSYLCFVYIKIGKFFIHLLSSLLFLNWVYGFFISSSLKNLSFTHRADYLWGEVFGRKTLNRLLLDTVNFYKYYRGFAILVIFIGFTFFFL